MVQAVKARYDVTFSQNGSGMKHRASGLEFPFTLRNDMYELTMGVKLSKKKTAGNESVHGGRTYTRAKASDRVRQPTNNGWMMMPLETENGQRP